MFTFTITTALDMTSSRYPGSMKIGELKGAGPLISPDSSSISELVRRVGMAKSDSFFIRHTTEIDNDNAYREGTIDLGAYVAALGKSVLRIHNIAVQMSDSTGRTSEVTSSGSDPFNGAAAQFQLCTQSQADIVLASDKSVISSGRIVCSGNGGVPSYVSQDFDNLPQLWTNGYLVAVDSIYLGGAASTGFDGDVYCTVTMECTVETMSQAAAMALALSQQ